MAVINIPGLFEQVIIPPVNTLFSTRETDPFNVYFDYGHYVEVTRNLVKKDKSMSNKDKKYPLTWLVMDFPEVYGPSQIGYCKLPRLDFIIAVPANPALTTPQRFTYNFIPRLWPIYDAFIKAIANSGLFNEQSVKELKHEKIDRPYWGGQDANGNGQVNLFNDKIDAVQIRGLELNLLSEKIPGCF